MKLRGITFFVLFGFVFKLYRDSSLPQTSVDFRWLVFLQGEIYFSALIPRHFSYMVLTLDGGVSTLSAPVSWLYPFHFSFNFQNFFSSSVTSALASGVLVALDPQEVDRIFLFTARAPGLWLLAFLWAAHSALALYWQCVVFSLKSLEFPWTRLNSTWSLGILSKLFPKSFVTFSDALPCLLVLEYANKSFHSDWIALPFSRVGMTITSRLNPDYFASSFKLHVTFMHPQQDFEFLGQRGYEKWIFIESTAPGTI